MKSIGKLLSEYLKLRFGTDRWVLAERERLRARDLPPELLEPLAACARVLARGLPATAPAVYEQLLSAVATRVGVLRAKLAYGESIPEPGREFR